jgi:hypothetical protein
MFCLMAYRVYIKMSTFVVKSQSPYKPTYMPDSCVVHSKYFSGVNRTSSFL